MSLLELRGVHRTFTRGPEVVEALRGVDLEVRAGGVTAIVGASGSGKTTLLNIVGGVDRPTRGEVIFEGRPIQALPERELTRLRRHRIGMIFQNFHLIPELTALENVRLPSMFSGVGSEAGARELMRRTEIASREGFRPSQLSGGEQQRVAIARALAHGPSLLLADEPTGNLDSEQGGRIFGLFDELAATGLAILVATHDASIAGRARDAYRLKDGILLG